MAIATIERDPARDTGTPDLRFRLLQQVGGSTVASFWRAIDRRSGKSCVVRVIDADREQSSRRLGELHRERTLAERIGHAGVLRADVPLIESGRIFQVVDPEPARGIEADSEGGRLSVLNLLVAVSSVLAEAHARGVFHGAFSRASCLRGGDGRVLVQGFMGDAASAAAVRDGAAADHRAFLGFATDMLRQTGGPPPRLRRYFTQHLSEAAPNPSATAMADLCADLRESLEDTFPWPLGGQVADAPVTAESPTPTLALPMALPGTEVSAETVVDLPAPLDTAQPALLKPVDAVRPGDSEAKAASPVAALRVLSPVARASQPALPPDDEVIPAAALPDPAAPDPAAEQPQGPVAPMLGATGRGRRAKGRSSARRADAPDAVSTLADVPVLQQLTASPAPATARGAGQAVREDQPRRRDWRLWLAALAALLAVAATLQFGSRSRPARTPDATAAAASDLPVAPDAMPASPAVAAGPGEPGRITPVPRDAVPAEPAAPAKLPREREASAAAKQMTAAPATRAVPAVVAPAKVPARATGTSTSTSAPAPSVPTVDASTQSSPRAVRSRVATLVAGGNRALTALEPGAAAEAFAAALELSPDDRAAREGSQRARRLQGVAALMRDAREATARGDHGRAVQGYSQALANDPRNRGLVDALATARRKLGRDSTGALLAEGHAALGAGRLEQARDAFEKALAADPLAPGARRAAEQAATAILLRDEAEARRATQAMAGRN